MTADVEHKQAVSPDFLSRLQASPLLQDITSQLSPKGPVMVCGADGAQKAWIEEAIRQGKPAILIVPDHKDLVRWEEDIHFFSPDAEILYFPIVEKADFAVTFTGTEALRGRMQALSALLNGRPVIVLATAVEAAQKITSPGELGKRKKDFHPEDVYDREELLNLLVEYGYERTDRVERSGHFAVRGDIVDIYGINEAHPVRIEFFDDEIDRLTEFDEDSQRTIDHVDQFSLFPVREADEADGCLADYAKNCALVFDEPQRGKEALRQYLREERENREKCWPWERLGKSKAKESLLFSLLNRSFPEFSVRGTVSWPGQTVTNFQRQIPLFASELKLLLEKNWETAVIVPKPSEKEELAGLLREQGIPVTDVPTPGKTALLDGLISKGFELKDLSLALFSAGDVLGRAKIRRRFKTQNKGQQIRFFSELNQGDYVVQETHGIGRYVGIRTIEIEGNHRDYITIQYSGGDKLYLPMEKIGTLEKYIGPEGQSPVLSKMGGIQWEKIRSKARKSIEDLAERLLAIYAQREITEGIAFDKDTKEQLEFEDAFQYVETPDQLDAAEAIKRAMEKPEPMDMLLCGDVGFGKTEVAMRAVFKAIMSGYQSIVLVPTTVLSQQHYETFTERMAPFGIHIAVLNRFCTAKEKKEILKGLAAGTIDVLIGTHAILSKQVQCKRLGLLVVDEEQRFGVVQKEKWKSRNGKIDILTLSATPIPRTLHMSLTGVRDMVTITQPPMNRHAIQTYVTEYDDQIVTDAILREKERGGQTYFIYNRIDSIDAMAAHLRNLLPENVTIGIAHGRMNGDQLEQVMFDFFQKKYDVLLCTTLIENGVDQPNANTMIVYDADRMGLSQLYQMRGRVGRSDRIARAYFFYRRGKVLSEVAEKRLDSIREFTELGAGFKIAMRDLEIRGAGNLLGAAQHGNIATVGFATYCTMLDEAIKTLKAKKEHKPLPKKMPNTVIEFTQDAYIDDSYIPKPDFKIEIYRRLASAASEKELDDLLDEVIDRFGTPTKPVEKLFAVARLRVLARSLGIGSITSDGADILLTWADTEPLTHFNVMALPKEYFAKLQFLPAAPVRVKINKAAIPGDKLAWMTELMKVIHKEIGNERATLGEDNEELRMKN